MLCCARRLFRSDRQEQFLREKLCRWPSGKASASKAADLGSIAAFAVDHFFQIESYQCLKIGTPVAFLPASWRFRINAVTVWSDVSIL